MNIFEKVLDELHVFEAKLGLFHSIKNLRRRIKFILPFWNTCSEGYWGRIRTIYTDKYQFDVAADPHLFQSFYSFLDYWTERLGCSYYTAGSCKSTDICLWHSAIDFYTCKLSEEQQHNIKHHGLLPTEKEELVWIKFSESVLENLHYADTLYNRYGLEKEQTRAITEELDNLRSVRKSMLKWNFEAVEEIKAHVIVVYESFEILFRRAAYFSVVEFFSIERIEKTRSELSILNKMVNSTQLQAKAVYLEVLRALKLTHGNGHSLACETLLSFIDDLQNILKTLLEDLPSSHKPVEIRDIVLELGFIRSIVEHTLEQPVESGVSYAIAAHVNILASQASDTLNVKYTAEEIPDFNTCDSNFRNLFYAQQKITDVRNNFRIKIRSYDVASCYVGDLLSYIRFIKEDDVSGKTLLANHFSEISLLHTFMKDTEYLLGLNPELNDLYNQIGRMFCGAWWDLQSLCFKNMNANESELSTLLLDFLKGVTANMRRPDELFVVLIRPLVQIPDTTYLMHHFHEAIAPAEEDKIFKNVLYSRRSNLVKLMESDAISDLLRDTNVDGIEAAHIYDLFIRELKGDASSSMEEKVDCFKASVKQAYVEYLKLPQKELSELEFFDMMLSLAEFKESDACFTIGTPQQIGVLHDDLVICGSVIRCCTTKHNIPTIKGLLTHIMKLGCQVRNILDTLEHKLFSVWFYKLWLFSVTEEVNLIKEKISRMNTFKIGVGLSEFSVQNKPEKLRATEGFSDDPCTQDGQILRFEEEDTLTAKLTTGSRSLEKIAIVGMPGLGKTTLAMNLYEGCAKSFHAHAWCFVGQEFHRKELLRDITSQISERPSSEINAMRQEDLAKLLKQSLLKKKNYLVVLDDVWDVDAWNTLQICFPLDNNGSRILITSRSKTIGMSVCGDKNVLELDLLSPDKSWNLLQNKIFGAKKCPQKLSQVGKGIVEKCGGLPLTIVTIAGVLKNKEKTENSWHEVAERLDSYLVDGVLSTLELSYKHLSVGMKQCFLYCKTFLKGKEIPRSKLVRLWLAERFVEESDEQESLEAAAEKYLFDLVDRSLLIIAKKGSDNRIQTCRIHDLLRDFCIQKANEEKFMITVDGWDDPASRQWRRRLCFSSSVDEFVKFKCEKGSTQQTARSLIFSRNGSGLLNKCDTSFIFDNFKSLTLLNLENIEMGNIFYASVGGLKLLRYLAVRGYMKSIPSSIGELLNLETLVVRGTRGEVEVPEAIFNLSKLRHLLVNARARVCVNQNSPNCLTSLQCFSTPVLSCTTSEQIISRLPNIRKLRCIFLEESFDLSILDRLCDLKSLTVFYYGLSRFQGKLGFHSNLYKLTLCKFRLPWSEIENIATLLPQLKILKLLFKAFEGHQWSTTATFENLRYLRMEELDIKEWIASDVNFPILERLVVRRCKLLEKIPEDLGDIGELMGIEAHWCDVSVGKSVLKIKRKQINDGNMKFKTVIYPTVLDLDDDDDDDEEEEDDEEL